MHLNVSNNAPTDANRDYDYFVYNQPDFLKHNNELEQIHYYGYTNDKAILHAAFSINEQIAYCPYRSPFGGIEYQRDLDQAHFQSFLLQVEESLKSKGVSEIHFHQPPAAYQLDGVLNNVFLSANYEIIQERQFHSIKVDDSVLKERMHKMEQRKLKLCLAGGAEFRQLKKKEAVEAFKWIERNRTIARKPPSMKWVDLENARSRNPKTFLVFGVFMDDYMLAATVLVRVNDKSVYHFMPASMVEFQHYRKYSPMVFLVNGLYTWCQQNEIKLLDLGTSYVDKRLKISLVQFKEHIGGKPSMAYSWRKHL